MAEWTHGTARWPPVPGEISHGQPYRVRPFVGQTEVVALRDPNLTSAIRNPQSPLRRYLDETFGNVRPLQTEYRGRVGPLLVPGGSADPAMIGTAFDLGVRFALDRGSVPRIAFFGFAGLPRCLEAIDHLVQTAQGSCGRDPELFAKACWALALTTDVYRQGGVLPSSPLTTLLKQGHFTADALLALASHDAIGQLTALATVARQRLLPDVHPPYDLGPSFATSGLCPADADLIAGGVLIELKTRLGPKNARTGARSDSLPRLDVYQLLGYVLFDRANSYDINAIGVYSARYGVLVRWSLPDVLRTLAGSAVDLPACRERVWRLLGGR